MYKDEDKRKETDRIRQKRRRDKIKAKGVTDTGRDEQGVTLQGMGVRGIVIKDLEKCRNCGDDLPPLERKRINLEACSKCIPERTAQGNIRVSKPGDDDYEPKTSEEAHKVLQGINYAQPAPPPTTPYPAKAKRGKDIKLRFNAGELSPCSEMRDAADVSSNPKLIDPKLCITEKTTIGDLKADIPKRGND